MTGIVLSTSLYLFVDYLKHEEALVLRLEEGSLVGMPTEAALSILMAIAVVNLPLFALDMQLVILHIFLYTQNLTTYEYIMNKMNDDEELDELQPPAPAAPAAASESPKELPTPPPPNVRRGWRRLKGMKKLPRCMDWIVFVRCGRSRRRSQRNSVEQLEAAVKNEETSAPSPEVPGAMASDHGHDRSVEHTPTPPGSTADDPLGDPRNLDIIPDTAASKVQLLGAGAAATGSAGAAPSEPSIIGASPPEDANDASRAGRSGGMEPEVHCNASASAASSRIHSKASPVQEARGRLIFSPCSDGIRRPAQADVHARSATSSMGHGDRATPSPAQEAKPVHREGYPEASNDTLPPLPCPDVPPDVASDEMAAPTLYPPQV